MKTIFILIVTALFLNSCVNIEKQIAYGNYDEAISSAVSKLSGKVKKNPKYVVGLEEALKRANQKDLERIEILKNSNVEDVDLQILDIYNNIDRRQALILPLLPLRDKNGYKADIQLLDISKSKEDYKNRAADFLYEQAQANLRLGRRGDKMAARQAWSELQEMEGILGSKNANVAGFKQEAKELGTVYIVVNPFIGDNISLSRDAANQFLDLNGFKDNSSTWRSVSFVKDRLKVYDLSVDLVFDNFDISPEKENTREYQDKKIIEVETGKKNREGKMIYEKKEVVANVIELYQFKEIVAQGTVFITEIGTKKEIYSQKIVSKKTFENYASTFKGDERALSDISRRRIGGRPLPFPKNDLMLSDVISILKSDLVNTMKKGYARY